MAKATVVGSAVVITSAAKLSDIKKVAKYRPNALVLKGGDDGKEEIFRVGVGKKGRASAYGIEFDSESRDGSGLATLTLGLESDIEDVRAYVADQLGSVLTNLNKIEGTWGGVIEEIDAEIGAVMGSIEVL